MRGCALVNQKGKKCITLSCQRVILGNDVENETRQSNEKEKKNDYWTRPSALVNNCAYHDIFLNLVRKLQPWDPIFDPS